MPPRLPEGLELIGEYEGSGFKEPPSLARRADGQMIQLTPLLYLVAKHADGERDEEAIAVAVSEEYGRAVTADNVRTLVEDKLRPLGVLAAADGTSPKLEKPDPLLALKFRKAIISEERCQPIASLFKPLFLTPVVLAVLAGLVAFDIWLFFDHGVAQSFRHALYEPALLLLVVAMVVISAGWHEFGHAAGCAYSGGCPGAMGAGVYLCYPAFYTDVTDSYRLTRAGRLRTDLAGVYFNGLFILATAGIYAVTGFEPLLLVILVQHLEVAHQLLPFLRLDGYYVIADLTGVPDMFSRIKPILASVLPWRKADERVTALKPWVRLVVTAWVLVVIPLLVFQLGMLLLHAPRLFATAGDSFAKHWAAVSDGFADGDALAALAGIVQTLILVVPLAGIVFTFGRLGKRLAAGGRRSTDGRPLARAGFVVLLVGMVGLLVQQWLPNGDYRPIRKGERGTLQEGFVAASRLSSGRSSVVPLERAPEDQDEEPAISEATPPIEGVTSSIPAGDADETPTTTVAPAVTEGTRSTTTRATTVTTEPVTTTTTRGDTTTDAPTTTAPETTTTAAP